MNKCIDDHQLLKSLDLELHTTLSKKLDEQQLKTQDNELSLSLSAAEKEKLISDNTIQS